MNKKSVFDTLFDRHVLSCVSERKLTGEEIHKIYSQKFPQGRIAKVFVPPVPAERVKISLECLVKNGLVKKELTRFTDHYIDETFVYYLSNAGRSALLPKKKET